MKEEEVRVRSIEFAFRYFDACPGYIPSSKEEIIKVASEFQNFIEYGSEKEEEEEEEEDK